MSHPVLAQLASADPEERREGCLAAARDPSAVLLLDALGAALADRDKRVRRAASDALAALSKSVDGVDAVLRRGLGADEPRARWSAAWTWSRIAPPEPRLLPAIVEAMASSDGDVRWAATRLLVEMGRLHREVLGVALGLVQGADDRVVQRMATFALRELAPDDPAAANALLQASRQPHVALRRATFTALAALVAPPASVVERLVEALGGDDDAACRRLAALALGELGAAGDAHLPPAARAALRDAESSADETLRRVASRALARVGYS